MLTAHAVEGMRLAREHLDMLRQAGPYRLGDAAVARVIATWEVTRDGLEQLFAEQGRRWQVAANGSREQGAVEHCCALVVQQRAVVEEILSLAGQLKAMTIERLMAKSDLEVGIEAVLGHHDNRPGPCLARPTSGGSGGHIGKLHPERPHSWPPRLAHVSWPLLGRCGARACRFGLPINSSVRGDERR